MDDLILKLDIAADHRGKKKEELSALLDEEIEKFSKYMSELGDWKSVGPLTPAERALIKTYLIQKIKLSNIEG